MKEIFYMMHVPWGWVKQRPHFIAEQLSEDFGMDIYFPYVYRKLGLVTNDSSLRLTGIFRFPLERFVLIRKLNKFVVRSLLRYVYRIHQYSIVWLTDARLFEYFDGLISERQFLVFDCMDDITEFSALSCRKDEMIRLEKDLLQKADLILFSSEELRKRKKEAYGLPGRICHTVFNALDQSLMSNKIYENFSSIFIEYHRKGYKIITYIGTVSDWFDFGLLEASLKDYSNIVYFIFGPVDSKVRQPENDRIIFFGAIEHKYIKSVILDSDIMVMPFKLMNLIAAVDPVKMYEYIAFGKQIISIGYPELEKFSKYVHFYSSPSGYSEALKELLESKEVDCVNQDFVEANTWEVRREVIVSLLSNTNILNGTSDSYPWSDTN